MKYIKLYESFYSITSILKEIGTKYSKEYNRDLIGLNSGMCEDIAYDTVELLGGSNDDMYILDDGFFWDSEHVSDIMTKGGDYWNMENMELYGMPPFDINLLSTFDLKGHTWIYCNKKHYDVEAIYGVDNFWDLPIYKRQLNIYHHKK